jgi:hypothetical protein
MSDKSVEKVRLNSTSHSVRASQAVLQYGVGAMVDFPSQTLMTAAPEYWENEVIKIHDERLEKALGVSYFGMPAGGKGRDGIAYARFPEWYFCPKCRKFQPLSKWIQEYNKIAKENDKIQNRNMAKHLLCPTHHIELVVARIITVCEHGHIDDFPWVKWVHAKSFGGAKDICNNPQLEFSTNPVSSEGLEGLRVKCKTCGASATLAGAFNEGEFEKIDEKYPGKYDFTCRGRHPWKHEKCDCGLYPKVLQRGSSSVYFPVTASSLVIPPYSNILNTMIEESNLYNDFRISIEQTRKMGKRLSAENMELGIQDTIDEYAEKIAINLGADKKQVKEILKRRVSHSTEKNYDTSSIAYRAAEFDALSGRATVSGTEYDDFKRISTDISLYNIPFVKEISLIEKIREVQVLLGFSRIEPFPASMIEMHSSKFVSVKEKETKWYPGYNVYGEGIFIEFDEDAINKWRSGNTVLEKRIKTLQDNYDNSFLGSQNPRKISGKFLLLHTISHLLIKQLSFECGYNISSLKERIYCGEEAEGKEMAAILIYTASGDSEGTLGGLVRQGYHDTFPGIYKKAIESAVSCSNDPVCSLSNGQGRDSLNLAACYSCALLPETCCEEFNVFLDRGVIVGTYEHKKLGFFYEQLYGNKEWGNVQVPEKHERLDRVDSDNRSVYIISGIELGAEEPESIIRDIRQFADTVGEEEIADFLEKSGVLLGKTMPNGNVRFGILGESEERECDYYWKNNNIMYFSSDQEDDMKAAEKAGVRCIYGPDGCTDKVKKLLGELI